MTKAKAAKPATWLGDLVPSAMNPRKPFDAAQLVAFKASLARFGDLGGIVRNVTTNQLIGGHKRIEAFRSANAVRVVSEPQPIDAQGTVAHGYVIVDGHRFAYREVEWSTQDETAANLAANQWGAEWDWKLVAEALKSIDDVELRTLTGFADHELANLLAAEWAPAEKADLMGGDADAGDTKITLTADQYDLLTHVKARLDPTGAISDSGAIERLCRTYLGE